MGLYYLKMALDADKRPPKGGWAPGTYMCLCHRCKKEFIGEKRAITCANCAYDANGQLIQEPKNDQ